MPFSTARKPRLKVNVNGMPLAAACLAEVTNASHFTADTFRVEAALGGLPAQMTLAWWSSTPDITLEVLAGLEDGSGNVAWMSLIYGQVDDIDVDLVRGTLTLTGRDLSARFLDAKTTEKFQNLTSSQIALQLALRRGLDANVTATSTPAGTYYEIDHARLTVEQTEWDLLIFLAENEGFDLWVSGQTLYFQPPPAPTVAPYRIQYVPPGAGQASLNVTDLKLRRSATLARDVIVKVQTWNQSRETSFVVTYKLSKAKSQRSGGTAQTYSYTVPNLTRDQALQWARKRAEDITRHERVIEAELPATTCSTRGPWCRSRAPAPTGSDLLPRCRRAAALLRGRLP